MEDTIFKIWIDRETPLPPDITHQVENPLGVTIAGDAAALVAILLSAMYSVPLIELIIHSAAQAHAEGIGRESKREFRHVVRGKIDGG